MNDYKPRKMMRKNRISPLILIITVIIFFTASYMLVHLFLPNSKVESPLTKAVGLSADKIGIVTGDEYLKLPNAPILKNGTLHFPADFIKANIDPYIFWEPKADRLSFTTENKVIAMKTEELNYFVNDEPMRLNLPVVKIGDMAYVPENFLLERYNVTFKYDKTYNLITFNKNEKIYQTADTVKNTALRYENSIKSSIAEKIEAGEKVVVLEKMTPDEKGKTSDFSKVRLENGLIGYVKTKLLDNFVDVAPQIKAVEKNEWNTPKIDGKIVLLWDQVFSAKTAQDPDRQQKHGDINVLSPTWFSFDAKNMEGDRSNISEIISFADMDYVNAAHENGYQVWALISDNFKSNIAKEILMKPENREKVIKQLLAFAATYKLDGINIDFEAITEETSPYFVQFLRELNPMLKQQNVILSVDVYVPKFSKERYNRTEIAKVVDFVCVMAYDEHWSGSDVTGPVASLGFVDEGISETLKEVPAEKILMGLPFYERVWFETEDGFVKTDKSMNNAYAEFMEGGVKFEWLPDVGYYYGEFETTVEGKKGTKKLWYEDARSIEEKLKLADAYNVRGVAGWKRYLENDAVWEKISAYKDIN